MSVLIQIDKDVFKVAQQVAREKSRSTSSQIELWARIGKCALENPDLPIQFVEDIICARHVDCTEISPFAFSL